MAQPTQPQKPDAVAFINAAKVLSEAECSPRLKKLLEAKLLEEVKIYRAEQLARKREMKMREM
ncbi:MAG: hypothetical protein ACRCU2_17815, partial [Planktothrix sp.]